MNNSRNSLIPAEDSITMYLSFDNDVDDTLPSKWESGVATQTSQYLETQNIEEDPKDNDTLEKNKNMNSVLDALKKNDVFKDQISPMRPFDQNILTKHNAMSSTPAKTSVFDVPQNMTETDITNKENTQPEEQNSTLTSTINASALTVKADAMITEENNTIHENSAKEPQIKSNVYPLSENVVLENITEVSNEEPSIRVASPLPVTIMDESASGTAVSNMVNEVSELIAKALQLTEGPVKTGSPKKKLSTNNLLRPRRSYLPTTGATLKQRMSIIVKTTLNSPSRKLALGNSVPRRSGLPTIKATNFGYRKSFHPCRTEVASTTTSDLKNSRRNSAVAAVKAKPMEKFNCKFCSAFFSEKSLLTMHMDTHIKSMLAARHKNSFFCKYCDKKFMLEHALHLHLLQHCDKIPPSEKRKLEFTELNHVEKAKLPKLVGIPLASNGDTTKPIQKKQKTDVELSMGTQYPATSSVCVANNVSGDQVPQDSRMPPPSVKKVMKKVAHAGVYRTPTKSVPCHICKISFKNILDYTNHCLTVHSKNKKQNVANALSAED